MLHHQEFSSMFGPFKRYRVTREAQSLSEAKDVEDGQLAVNSQSGGRKS